MAKNILGISAFYHDSAAALIVGGKVIAAAQEERFTREKHTSDFPVNAIKYCLEFGGLDLDELDAIVFYDKPLLKFERLLDTYYAFAPKGLISFLQSIPIWLKEKIFLKKKIFDSLKDVGVYDRKKVKLLFTEHHLAHAASSFFPSPYTEAAILTIDGVGEWNTATISIGKGANVRILREMNFPHSVGLLYSSFTYFLGFKVNSGEYKLMGLAPYGSHGADRTLELERIIKRNLVTINGDGSIWLNQAYFTYATGLKMVPDNKWEVLFGFPRRTPEEEIVQHHCDLALAIQNIVEEIMLKIAVEAKKITGAENLCMAGGVALNCVANGKLIKAGIFRNVFITPAAGDAGGALGAALAISHMYFDEARVIDVPDCLQGSYLGPDYSEKEIELMSKRVKAVYQKYSNFNKLSADVAMKLSEGNIIGWFQGRMEFGPRALGNRSIIGNAASVGMQKKLNIQIKKREGFRPFAPSVLAEDAKDYFEMDSNSPYMLFVAPVQKQHRYPSPSGFAEMIIWDKLYAKRSDIQAVTHVDFSARVQTVHKETNPRFWTLINAFKKQTGVGLIINTSFNVRGEPIVCTPYDAYKCFMATEMDYLVINDFVFVKTMQPAPENSAKWASSYQRD